MRKNMMLCRHVPSLNEVGDCFRACLSSLLNLDPLDVPHFAHIWFDCDTKTVNQRGADSHLKDWLAERGYTNLDIPYGPELEPVVATVAKCNGKVRCIVTGRGASGHDHCVVYEGDQMIHDPAGGPGLIGPAHDGNYWAMFILPLSMRGIE